MITTLYVGNLPWSVTEVELYNCFAAHGKVKGARVIVDRMTGRSRGFGFVEVAQEDAAKVIETLNGSMLGGRAITVNEAQPRQQRV
ncbi:MAG: RNA recognition motif domain-containing protein [Mycobacterium leprae]